MPDAVERPLTPNVFARLAEATRYAVTGVTPQSWFGPLEPLQPQAPPEVKGRQFDYPFGANLNYVPRSEGGIGFAELRTLADALPLLRAVIETRKDQVAAQNFTVRARARANLPDQSARIDKALAFIARPDRRRSFGDWLRMLIEDLLVIDAATIYPRYDRGGKLYALDVIDGATIKPLIGEDGRAPEPPDPAYQQVLHGVPAADFSAEELLYLPRNVRAHRLYGMSPVEQVALTVNIALRREAATLDYYRTGSSPDAFATLPKEWTIDQVKSFQDYFDALMSGNAARRRMLKFMPSEFKLIETRQPPLKDLYDEWLARVICYAFSVPATPFVAQVNRATSETMRLQATQEGLVPLKTWIKNALDQVIQVCMGEPNLEFVWVGDDAVDPLQQAQTLQILVSAGIKTREEARAELGLGGDKRGCGSRKVQPQPRRARAVRDGGQSWRARRRGQVVIETDRTFLVAGLVNTATDAIVDGGAADQASEAQLDSVLAADRNKSPQDLTIVPELPDDAVPLKAGDGTSFYAPPYANFQKVYAAGQSHWQDPISALLAIGHYGTYDFQRNDGVFYSAYTDASNYAVGVYMAGAGYSYNATIAIGAIFADLYSSNAGSEGQKRWWTRGWNDATNSLGPFSNPPNK